MGTITRECGRPNRKVGGDANEAGGVPTRDWAGGYQAGKVEKIGYRLKIMMQREINEMI